MDQIRLLLAGLLCFIGLLLGAHIAFEVLPKSSSPMLIGLGLGVGLILLAVFVWFIFHVGRPKVPQGPTVEELRAQGLVIEEYYQARRAFEIDEFEDEGRHYFIELRDGTVLFLSGQYLYDVGDEQEPPGQIPSHSFPNSDFTLLRHRTGNYVLDIIRRGFYLRPEALGPPFTDSYYNDPKAPQDGEIIRDRSFDVLKARYVTAAKVRR